MPNRSKFIFGILLLLIVLQFIPVDRTTPSLDAKKDFIKMTNAPASIAASLRNACYDCHSYETNYPWYARVAPLSFWIQGHIRNGRKKLNFSTWASTEKKTHLLEESAEEIEEHKMPLKSYTWLHPTAKLNESDHKALVNWLEATAKTEN